MKQRMAVVCWLCLLLTVLSVACGGASTPASDVTITATPAILPTSTPPPPPPTVTVTPAPTPTPTPVVRPGAALGPDNIAQLTQLAQIGRGEIHTVQWSPDSRMVAVATGLGVYLFDGATFELLEHLPTGYTNHARFSPDSALLALAASDWYGVWDLAAGDYRFWQETIYSVDDLAFDSEGATLLVAATESVPVSTPYGTISRYDLHVQHYAVADGTRLHTFKLVDPNNRALVPQFIDGGRVVQTQSPPNDYFWWDTQTGQRLYAYNTAGATVAALRVAGPRAFTIVWPDLTRVNVMDLTSGDVVGELIPGGDTYGMSLSDDGQTLFVLADQITRWDVATLERQAAFTLSSAGRRGLRVSPDLTRAIITEDGALRLLDLAADTIMAEQSAFYDRAWEVALNADGSVLAVSRGSHYTRNSRVESWHTGRLERLAVIEPGQENSLVSLAFDAQGRILTGIAELREVRFWDAQTGANAGTLALDSGLTKFTLPYVGNYLAIGHSADGSLWDVATGSRLADVGNYGEYLTRIVVSEDGALVALTYFSEYGVALWDVSGAQPLITARDCGRAVISPDGAQFACRQSDTLLLWNVAANSQLDTIALPAEVVHLTYTPDSRLLVASCEDAALYFWDAAGGALLYRVDYPVRNFTFSADGRLLLTAASDGTVRLWGIEQ